MSQVIQLLLSDCDRLHYAASANWRAASFASVPHVDGFSTGHRLQIVLLFNSFPGIKNMKQVLSDIGWLWPIGLAIATWFAVEFVAKPFIRIRDLRREILTSLIRADFLTFIILLTTPTKSREELIDLRMSEAQKFKIEMHNLSIALRVFVHSEPLATKLLSALGYDLESANRTLITLSLTKVTRDLSPFGSNDKNWELLQKFIRESLKLPFEPYTEEDHEVVMRRLAED